MAFVVSTLQKSIKTVFDSMGEKATNTDFANGISNAVVAFVSTGTVVTIDSGAVTGGTFSGAGTGTLTVTSADCAKIIKDACDVMNSQGKGNDYLAEKMGEAFEKMADKGKVNTTVTGMITTPTGVTTPSAGSASGTISCSADALVEGLKALFSKMNDKSGDTSFDGNLEFAKELASQLNTFWTSGSISTDGSGAIQGSSGSGTIS